MKTRVSKYHKMLAQIAADSMFPPIKRPATVQFFAEAFARELGPVNKIFGGFFADAEDEFLVIHLGSKPKQVKPRSRK